MKDGIQSSFWDSNSAVHLKRCSRFWWDQLFPDGALCDMIHYWEVSHMFMCYAASDPTPVDQFPYILYNGIGLLSKRRKGKYIIRKMCLSLRWLTSDSKADRIKYSQIAIKSLVDSLEEYCHIADSILVSFFFFLDSWNLRHSNS